MRSLRFSSLALAAALSLTMTACGGGDSEEDTDTAAPAEETDFPEGSRMKALADAGKLRVGTKFDQPLFGLKGLSGEPEGFDVEIAKIIAAKLGIGEEDIEFIEAVSANREPFLQQNRVDMVVATYTINDKRDMVVDFAGPYFQAGQSLLVRADETEITGPQTLKGKKVCSVSGSTPIQRVRDQGLTEPENIVEFQTYTQCVDQLLTNQVDAVTTDDAILAGYASQQPDELKLVGEPFSEEPYGIGLKKDDKAFRDFLNDRIEAICGDRSWSGAFSSTLGKLGLDTPQCPDVDRYDASTASSSSSSAAIWGGEAT